MAPIQTYDEIADDLQEMNPEALLADGFEGALIGTAFRFNDGPLALYDYDKCVETLVKRDTMTHEEALEWMGFNVLGAWVGDGTPVFAVIR